MNEAWTMSYSIFILVLFLPAAKPLSFLNVNSLFHLADSSCWGALGHRAQVSAPDLFLCSPPTHISNPYRPHRHSWPLL